MRGNGIEKRRLRNYFFTNFDGIINSIEFASELCARVLAY